MEKGFTPLFDLNPALPHPTLVAGPCAAESETQMLETARALAAQGVKLFRAGLWKGRTMPHQFEGVGTQGLPWLVRIREETGMLVGTEVATAEQAQAAREVGLDFVWIGARTTSNPFTIDDIGKALRGADLALFVKNPIAPDIQLWIGAIERLQGHGLTRLAALHRGFSTETTSPFRNEPLWYKPLRLRIRYPDLPLFCDPSHIAGRRELIPAVAQEALDRCYDGLFIECHIHPEEALSDAAQQLTPAALDTLMQSLHVGRETKPFEEQEIEEWRQEIDALDEKMIHLLARRIDLSRKIGHWKRQNGATVLQMDRYRQIRQYHRSLAEQYTITPDLISDLFEIIHDHSVQIQSALLQTTKDDDDDNHRHENNSQGD